MRFGSVCSGIEAASVAWHPLGWQAAWLSEIEPFPSAVLAHHYPDVPNLGDMTLLPERILSGEIEAPDVFCGGTPCQAFSVAGLRNSLDDARGNLSLTFVGIANAIDHVRSVRSDAPAIIFWENVPGVLSTKDNAFGCFLAGIAGENNPLEPPRGKWTNSGYVLGPKRTVAWRVLDAQYFGVAQRRRRVFVVASARADFDPAKVLFEFDGVRRDTAPSREAGQRIAPYVTNGPPFSRTGNERVECEAIIAMAHGQGGAEISVNRSPTLTCNHEAPIAAYAIQGAGATSQSSQGSGWNKEVQFTLNRLDVHGVVQPISFGAQMSVPQVDFDLNQTLQAKNPMAVAQPVAFEPGKMQRLGYGNAEPGLAPTLRADAGDNQLAVAQVVGALACNTGPNGHDAGNFACNQAVDAGHVLPMHAMAVRRLTATECERLQGFPDGYTNIPWRKKPESPDGPRYKALGNSWAVPVVAWIGNRIKEHLNEPHTSN
jgi:DNA (cytosine-5)-methyltransferase 1